MFREKETGRILGTGKRHNGRWYVDKKVAVLTATMTRKHEEEAMLQHYRLGHLSFESMNKMYSESLNKVDMNKLVCDACELAKHTRSTYKSIGLQSSKPFALVHSDAWGPYPTPNMNGFRWFVTFIDCYSRITWLYLMKQKSEVMKYFQNFDSYVRTQFDKRIKVLRSDNRTEYTNRKFSVFLLS